jgi:hypothetical protein
MADGKREHDYDVAINLAGYVNACLSGKFNPNTANPVRAEVQNALIEANSDPKGRGSVPSVACGFGVYRGIMAEGS